MTINGQPRGNTPLTITDLSPGEYQILMALPGYRTFTTTVRVVAGGDGARRGGIEQAEVHVGRGTVEGRAVDVVARGGNRCDAALRRLKSN